MQVPTATGNLVTIRVTCATYGRKAGEPLQVEGDQSKDFLVERSPKGVVLMVADEAHAMVPFSISCRYCDAGAELTATDALAECWLEIEFFPDGAAENFLGVCPDCVREMLKEVDERKDAYRTLSADVDTEARNLPMAKSGPAHEVRLGSIKAVIWANETEHGVRHNVTFVRLYRDGDDWKETTSFGRDDLLVLAKVADLAHTWSHENSG